MTDYVGRVHIDQAAFAAAEAFLTRIDFLVRGMVVEKALRKAAAPAEQRARQLAPDSKKSGSRDKWSRKTAAKRAHTKQHRLTIGHSSVRNYERGLLAIYVGPIHPAGNLINVIGHQHRQMLWGRASGQIIPGTKYLKDAGEQTIAQQNSAFVSTVKSEVEKILANP